MAKTIPIFAEKRQSTVALQEFRISPPLALYVHVPWCVQKCPYCDFNSHEANGEIPEREYVDALIADLQSALPLIWGRGIHSIFIGGGTPSLFAPEAIDRLLGDIRARLRQRVRHAKANAAIAACDERDAASEIEGFIGHA